MNKERLYSQFGRLALAVRKQMNIQATIGGDEARSAQAELEPELPPGYRHICSAISALLADGEWHEVVIGIEDKLEEKQ